MNICGASVAVCIQRAGVLTLGWWAMTEGKAGSWGVGLVTIALASIVSLRLLPPTGRAPRWRDAVGLLGFFLVHSVRGGLQVARQALGPTRHLSPGVLEVALMPTTEPQRVLLINLLNLMPGTVCVDIDDNRLLLHVLDTRAPVANEVHRVAARIARLMGDRE